LFTIGVYGYSEQEFFHALCANDIDTFCDIRQRRGVRGSKYAFVNSTRLQEHLNVKGIRYLHLKALAPTPEIRDAQKQADKERRVAKRERNRLHPAFVRAYERERLASASTKQILEMLPIDARNVVLFCVE